MRLFTKYSVLGILFNLNVMVIHADENRAKENVVTQERSQTLDLVQAYELALQHNFDYQSIRQQQKSANAQRNVGRSYLLPSLFLNYTHARNWSEIEQDSGTNTVKEDREYESYNASLRLQQTLFDYAAWNGYKKTDQLALEAAQKVYDEALQLAFDLLEVYTQTLLARDQKNLAAQQMSHQQQLLKRNLAMKAAGEETQTAVLETQSRLYVSESEQLAAIDELDLALRELSRLTGQRISEQDLPELVSAPIQLPLVLNSLEEWQTTALSHNHQLQALHHKIRSMDYELEEQRSGHLPKLNVFASTSLSDSNTENTYQQTYDTDTVGVQIQMPLFLGGRVSYGMGQVRAEKSSLEYQRQSLQATIKLQVRRYFNQCRRSVTELKARRFAVDSAKALVTATDMSIRGGVRSNQDALNAQQQLYTAKRDLAESRYEYLKAWLGLHREAANLNAGHLSLIAAVFE